MPYTFKKTQLSATIQRVKREMQKYLRATAPLLILAGLTLFISGCGGPNLFDYAVNFGRNGICWAIVIILDIIAIVEVAGSSRSTGDKVVWALLIIFSRFLAVFYITCLQGSRFFCADPNKCRIS